MLLIFVFKGMSEHLIMHSFVIVMGTSSVSNTLLFKNDQCLTSLTVHHVNYDANVYSTTFKLYEVWFVISNTAYLVKTYNLK